MVLQNDSTKSIQSSTIESDLPCRQCGYNLRGLMSSGACPECGHAVAESARANLLKDSDPSYAWALAVGAVLMILGLGLSSFSSALIPPTMMIDYLDVQSWTGLAVFLIVVAIFVMSVGLWKVTTIDPAVFEDRRHERLRWLVRVTVVIGALTQLFGIAILSSLGDQTTLPPLAGLVLLWLLILANAIALITNVFATLGYLRMLSCRIPDQVLARRFGILRWVFGIPFSLLTLAAASELSLQFSAWGGVIDDPIVAANTIVWGITVFVGLFYVAALLRLRRGAFAALEVKRGRS